jgi:hypothetical protein
MLESRSDMSFSRSRARIHYAQIPLFPLSALVVITLVHGRSDAAAIICRLAMFVFTVSYVAFGTAAGVVTGHIPSWGDPLPGPSPFLAVLGSVALLVGAMERSRVS